MTNGHIEGILQFTDDRRDGELRDVQHPLRPVRGNITVPKQVIKQMRLRPGLLLRGQPRGRFLDRFDSIEGQAPDDYQDVISIYDATALDPEPMIKLEHNPAEPTTRIMDILCPIGFGQRGLIVAPPRTGKTILLQNIAKGIHANYPTTQLYLLLIDERPEEVTDMRRNVPGHVFASSNDNTVDKHLDLATLVIERCKRQVEFGQNVIVLLDSLTRLGRNFNVGGPSGGRTLSGGLDNRALEIPKKLFGAARKIENGGSLTIIATCLIDTGSKMDQVIFEEFKGTGNSELVLSRELAERRIYPAIDLVASATRREELLFSEEALAASRLLRQRLAGMSQINAMNDLLTDMRRNRTNEELVRTLAAG